MLSDDARKRLVAVIEANLPPEMTEEQANFWVAHPDYVRNAIKDLSKVSVLPMEPK